MSSTWLLSWNPKRWVWENYSEWCDVIKEGETRVEPWTCHSKKPSVGDEFYLMKTGDRHRGIIGHGHIVKESYPAPHFDQENAVKGKKTNHVDAEFDLLINYETESILSQDALKKLLPEQQWSPQGSGIQIREEVLPGLRKLWNDLKRKRHE